MSVAAVKTRLIKIGKSRGIRIPQTILKQVDLGDGVIVEVDRNQLIVRTARHPREGWEESFRLLAPPGYEDGRKPAITVVE